MTKKSFVFGLSLLEILVVVSIFSVLGILSTRAVLLTLRGTQKSDSALRVRENLSYSLAVIERQLRNAENITPCPNPDPSILVYTDLLGKTTSFSCINPGPSGYVASDSARLTSDEIAVTDCSFVCEVPTPGVPPAVSVFLSAEDAKDIGVEKVQVTTSTKILLRTY